MKKKGKQKKKTIQTIPRSPQASPSRTRLNELVGHLVGSEQLTQHPEEKEGKEEEVDDRNVDGGCPGGATRNDRGKSLHLPAFPSERLRDSCNTDWCGNRRVSCFVLHVRSLNEQVCGVLWSSEHACAVFTCFVFAVRFL